MFLDGIGRYLLAIDSPKDLEEYLQELLDVADPKAKAFIEELLQKKRGTAPPENVTVSSGSFWCCFESTA